MPPLTLVEDIHQTYKKVLSHTVVVVGCTSNCTMECNLSEIFIKAKRVLALLRPCKDLLQATFLAQVLIHYN